MRLEIEDNALVLNFIEKGTEYKKENFEIEFFEVENKQVRTNQGNQEVETLKRIYTSKTTPEVASRDYIEEYFEFLIDQEVADEFGIDLVGINPGKLKGMIKSAIDRSRGGDRTVPEFEALDPDSVIGECD